MRKLRSLLFLLLLISHFFGCSTYHRVTPGQERPAFNGDVLIYDKTIPDTVQYTVMGEFTFQKAWYGGTGETASYAAKSAAENGANGILIEVSGHRMSGFAWAAPFTEGKLLWIENYKFAKSEKFNGPGKGSVKDRLQELDELRQSKVISEGEYAERRAAIIKDL